MNINAAKEKMMWRSIVLNIANRICTCEGLQIRKAKRLDAVRQTAQAAVKNVKVKFKINLQWTRVD